MPLRPVPQLAGTQLRDAGQIARVGAIADQGNVAAMQGNTFANIASNTQARGDSAAAQLRQIREQRKLRFLASIQNILNTRANAAVQEASQPSGFGF